MDKRRFFWPLLLFWLYPILMILMPIFPGFRPVADYEFMYCTADGISATQVSLYRCFSLVGGVENAFFWMGIIASVILAVFATVSSFLPRFRKGRALPLTMMGLFGFVSAAMIICHVMLAHDIEVATQAYLASVERTIDPYSAFGVATMTFYIEMGVPTLLALWWFATMMISFFAKPKKED